MNDYDSTGPYGVPGSGEPSADEPDPTPAAGREQPSGLRRLFSRKRNIVITGAAVACAVAGVSIGLVATSGSSSTTTAASSTAVSGGQGGPFAGASAGSGGGSNARSGPEPGGSSGTVTSVSGSGFTLTTPAGEKVTVNESSSTTYQDGSASSTASAITSGSGVLVLGTVNSTTISATQVTIEPTGSPYTTTSSAVTALQKGQTNTSVSIGSIPSDYTEGQGTIVSGSTADQATQAALAAYPGGIVDRVVQLGDGEYEVHYIGTDLHHIFVNSSFQVVGAN
jgi:Domain of unknown function (DUF5666)